MKKNLIHVILPADKVISFVHESDDTVENILEATFGMFNHGSGVESELFLNSKCRSLSVHDIVCVNGKYHQCLPCGWSEVTTDYVNQLEEDVENNPRRAEGAWFALSEVMYSRSSDGAEANLDGIDVF